MPNEIGIAEKFQPLFELLDETSHPEVDTVVLTGGRGSTKSWNVAATVLIGVADYDWNVLYSRFTNTSIGDSIKSEVSDKIETLGLTNDLIDNKYSIESKIGGGYISFKGIKTGSNGQTANLKSLSGFNCFIVDEAEEIPNYAVFKKVFYSIRSSERRNLSILILNPSTKDHWIYQELFEAHDIPDGFCGVKNNILYIHSSYLDVNPDYIPDNIRKDYERLKEINIDEYNNVVLGGWRTDIEGALLPLSCLSFAPTPIEEPNDLVANIAVSDPADGGGDKLSTIFLKLVYTDKKLIVYVQDVVHSSKGIGSNTERIMDRIKRYGTERIHIEGNGVGKALLYELRRENDTECVVEGYHEKMNKDAKINAYYEFVRDHFLFQENYRDIEDYKLYINDLVSYEKEGQNQHRKDAIDVACAASKLIKVKYKSLIYGNNN